MLARFQVTGKPREPFQALRVGAGQVHDIKGEWGGPGPAPKVLPLRRFVTEPLGKQRVQLAAFLEVRDCRVQLAARITIRLANAQADAAAQANLVGHRQFTIRIRDHRLQVVVIGQDRVGFTILDRATVSSGVANSGTVAPEAAWSA